MSQDDHTTREAEGKPRGIDRVRRGGGLLRDRRVATIALASLAARLPLTMMGLATIFYVQGKSGSIALAGLALAAFSLMAGLLAPLRGRLVDRRGIRRGLLPLGLAHAVATAAFLPASALPGSDVLFVLVAAVGGATAPPVNASMRALWPSLVARERLDAAYGLEAVLQELAYLAGPLISGLLIVVISTTAPIVVAAVLTAAGTALFSGHPSAAHLRPAPPASPASLRSAGVRVLMGSLGVGAVAIGVLEVAIPAFSEEHGSAASAGLLISLMSVGSISGGVWYGMRRWTASAIARLIGASAIATAAYAAAIFADSTAALGLCLLVFGVTLAPSLAAVYSILDDVAPQGTAVESVTWITTATAGGAACGAMAAGIVIEEASIQLALGVGALAMAAATVVPFLWREKLTGKAGARVAEMPIGNAGTPSG